EPLYLSLCPTSNLSLGGLQAPVLPPSWRGYPPELEGKQKRRANWARAACVSISHNRYLTPFVPEPAGRMTCSFEQVNGNILLHEARDGAGAVFCSEPPGNRHRRTCARARAPPPASCGNRAGSACCSRGPPSTSPATRRAHVRCGSRDRRCRAASRRRTA